jgi:hypothetical protein
MQNRAALLMVFLCILSVAALPRVAVGQDEEASSGVASNDEIVEDIVVVAQKSQSDLRREVYEAEEHFYSVYNDLNDDKDYDVRCFYEKPTGTNIKNHVCRARFVTKAYERYARRNRNDLSRVANQSAIPVPAEQTARYQEIMETLIAANPQLQEALIRYNTVSAQFMAKREENSGN